MVLKQQKRSCTRRKINKEMQSSRPKSFFLTPFEVGQVWNWDLDSWLGAEAVKAVMASERLSAPGLVRNQYPDPLDTRKGQAISVLKNTGTRLKKTFRIGCKITERVLHEM